jgi:death-on-curing protein
MTPPRETSYLTLADAIALHDAVMRRTEYMPAPLREEGLLESALQRPRMAAYYEEANLVRQAALLAVGVAQAQAFLDGNKRTAFAVLDVFLRINGAIYNRDPIALARQLEALAERSDSLDAATGRFEDWLRGQVA